MRSSQAPSVEATLPKRRPAHPPSELVVGAAGYGSPGAMMWCEHSRAHAAGPETGGRRSITVDDLGEFGLIAAIKALLPVGPAQVLGIGDDAAVVRAPDRRVVATTALLVGLATPGDLAVTWAEDLARGLADECSRAGASVVGGDVVGADSVMLAVTALGDLAGRAPVTRSGARVGDLLAVAGPLGRSAAGLGLLKAGAAGTTGAAGAETAGTAELAGLVTSHRRPRPPYDAGPEAADLGATSMIDISDGLVADLRHVAEASGVLVDIDTG